MDRWGAMAAGLCVSLLAGCAAADDPLLRQAVAMRYAGEVAAPTAEAGPGWPVHRCDFRTNCPEIAIGGLPLEHACLPVGGKPVFGVCPVRGLHDAGLTRDPETGRLWMAHTFSTIVFDGAPSSDSAKGIHKIALAQSDDQGRSWSHVGFLAAGAPFTHPEKGRGLKLYEVPTLARMADGRWTISYFKYFNKYEDAVFVSKTAATPQDLLRAPESGDAAGWANPAVWPARVDLSKADPSLARCAVFTEPALFTERGRTYFVAECLDWNLDRGEPNFDRGGVHVFEIPDGPGGDEYRFVGTLIDYDDMRALRPGATRLVASQPSIARSRDGGLLLLIAMGDYDAEPRYGGCHAVEIEDLAKGLIARNADGAPLTRLEIWGPGAASGLLGPGQCAYHPDSATGVIMTHMREDKSVDPADLRIALHATGVHP